MSDHLTLESHPAWEKFQSLHKDLKRFLKTDLEYREATKDQLRAVMAHFGISAEYRRSSSQKGVLFANYQEQLIPYIRPFLDAQQIIIDTENVVKLDVNSLATTKDDLIRELKKHVPTLITNSMMDRAELIRSYQRSVFLEKSTPAGTEGSTSTSNFTDTRYMAIPHRWNNEELLRMRRDDIRSALQFYRPDIFIPTKFLSLEVCTRIYQKFMLDMDVEQDVIVHGVHYYCRPM